VTKSVTFDVKYGGTVVAMGGTHAGFKATTTIDRFDYNLKWSKTTEAGGMVAGKGCGNYDQCRFQEIHNQAKA
jgi:polyisoprenoid-binding protein YceI